MLKSYRVVGWWWGGGPCDFSVSPSPFALDFGTLDFGTLDPGLTASHTVNNVKLNKSKAVLKNDFRSVNEF